MTAPVHEALRHAAARAAATTVGRPRRTVGPARIDPTAASAEGHWQVVVDTGDERLVDGVPQRLVLVDPAGDAVVHPVRVRYWDGPSLGLDCTGEIPASLAATAAGATPWLLVSDAGPDALPAACDAALAVLPPPAGHDRRADGPGSGSDRVAVEQLTVEPAEPGSVAHVEAVSAAAGRVGPGPVLVVAAPSDADAVAEAMGRSGPAGRVVRAGTAAARRIADHPGVGPAAAAVTGPASAGHDPLAGAAAALATAQAVLSESRALRRVAEAHAETAAAAVIEAEAALDLVRSVRHAVADVVDVARSAEKATAAHAAAALEVGRLAAAVRRAGPDEVGPLTVALARAAEAATAGAGRRDALVGQLEDRHRHLLALGTDAREVRDAERQAVRARAADRDADAALQEALDRERRAGHEVGVLARLLAGAAEVGAALQRAEVVVCAPHDVLLDPALGGHRPAHVVIDLTRQPDPAVIALAAARARRTVTLLTPA